MKVNLRRAAQIRTAIEQAIASIPLDTAAVVGVFESKPFDVLDTARTRFLENGKTAQLLTNILFDLRQRIAEANMTSGITGLLAEKERLTRNQEIVSVMATGLRMPSEETLAAQLASYRKQFEDARYRPADSISVGVLIEEDEAIAKNTMLGYKRQLQAISDELLALNYKTEITIPDSEIEFLRTSGVI